MHITHDIRPFTDISRLVAVMIEPGDTLALKIEYDEMVIKKSKVEGFRKGKATIGVIARKIGRDKYWKDMREFIASKALYDSCACPPSYHCSHSQHQTYNQSDDRNNISLFKSGHCVIRDWFDDRF